MNCGKSIPEGQKHCEDCRKMPPDRMSDYLIGSSDEKTIRRRSKGHIWLVVGALIIFSILIGIAYTMMSLFPTEQIRERQAERCRARLADVKEAVNNYVADNGVLPPDGRLNEDHALATGGYIEPPNCPSTGNYYIIEYRNGELFVICDSKLKGHEL
ncbi:MAG: hypothetical protein JW738_06900 [Actinobacteria bacterium]|nr:hypothetical protein [Actinomycetota bacterium]